MLWTTGAPFGTSCGYSSYAAAYGSAPHFAALSAMNLAFDDNDTALRALENKQAFNALPK
jgi:hypothetical protein